MTEFLAPTLDMWNMPKNFEVISENMSYHDLRVTYERELPESREKELRLIANGIKNNIVIATSDTFKALDVMQIVGIEALSAHLNVVSRDSLRVLITVSDEDFVKESFLGIYSLVREIADNSRTAFYTIDFTFINKSPSFNVDELVQEGFIFSFKPLEKAQETSSTATSIL